jgi:hypothetical protein
MKMSHQRIPMEVIQPTIDETTNQFYDYWELLRTRIKQ